MLVLVSTPESQLEGFVREGADLSGSFQLIEEGTFEAFTVKGWECDVERSKPSPFKLSEYEIVCAVWACFEENGREMGRLGYVKRLGDDRFELATSERTYLVTNSQFSARVETGGKTGRGHTVAAAAGDVLRQL